MPNLTIASPGANATVSMYFFTASGLANQLPPLNPVSLKRDEPEPPLYFRVQCELFKAGDPTATATIEMCPFIVDEVAQTLTWYAAFFPLQVMTGARLKATLFLAGEAATTSSKFIDVADVMPSIGIGIVIGDVPVPPPAPMTPPVDPPPPVIPPMPPATQGMG